MNKVSNNPINISKNSGFVEERLVDCIKDIIFELQMEFDIEYNDTTYRELYIKTAQFAKEIDAILSADITQRDDMFKSTPDFFSFKNNKMV